MTGFLARLRGEKLDVFGSTFLTVGTAASQPILAINNLASPGGRIVTLRYLHAFCFQAGAAGDTINLYKATGAATSGTAMVINTLRRRRTGMWAPVATVLQGTATEGGNATAISVPAGGLLIARAIVTGTAQNEIIVDERGVDRESEAPGIEPGECFYVEVDALATNYNALNFQISEYMGLT